MGKRSGREARRDGRNHPGSWLDPGYTGSDLEDEEISAAVSILSFSFYFGPGVLKFMFGDFDGSGGRAV